MRVINPQPLLRKKKGATFLSLGEPWANTSTAVGKLMLTVLGGIAEFEKDLIALRTNDGRARARQAGVKFGPKFKLSQDGGNQKAKGSRRIVSLLGPVIWSVAKYA